MAVNDFFDLLLKKSMALCAGREMCISDMAIKLESWGANEKQSEKIIKKLTTEKFIDEERYATAFTRDKFRYNKWGKIKIAHGLKMKRIHAEIINRALDVIDDGTYKASLKNVMEAQKKKIKAKNQFDLKGKLLRYGMAKGFESHLLYDLLNDFH